MYGAKPVVRAAFRVIAAAVILAACGNCAFGAFKAAIAVRDVTPNPPLPVSGGIGPSSPTSKILGRLTVRALVLEDDGTRVAICSVDFLGFPSVLCDRVRRKVSGIKPENIMIGATHTHSAPDCYGFPDAEGKVTADMKYVAGVCDSLAEAINEAVDNLAPARIRVATGVAHGKIAYNYYAEQLYDPRCSVIQVLDEKGRAKATLVNYACHPEVIGSQQGILCPDFVGPLYDRIAEKGGGVGIYMNGAQGGMVTADCRGPDGHDQRTWQQCERIGRLLADESLRIIADANVCEEPGLFCGSIVVKFPVENPVMLSIARNSPLKAKLDEHNRIGVQVNVVNLADAQILTIPGEALPNIGYYLKRKMHGRDNLLFGLTNDALGYMLTKVDYDSFDRYKYITQTSLGENTAEIFMTEALAFVDRCPRPVSGN